MFNSFTVFWRLCEFKTNSIDRCSRYYCFTCVRVSAIVHKIARESWFHNKIFVYPRFVDPGFVWRTRTTAKITRISNNHVSLCAIFIDFSIVRWNCDLDSYSSRAKKKFRLILRNSIKSQNFWVKSELKLQENDVRCVLLNLNISLLIFSRVQKLTQRLLHLDEECLVIQSMQSFQLVRFRYQSAAFIYVTNYRGLFIAFHLNKVLFFAQRSIETYYTDLQSHSTLFWFT